MQNTRAHLPTDHKCTHLMFPYRLNILLLHINIPAGGWPSRCSHVPLPSSRKNTSLLPTLATITLCSTHSHGCGDKKLCTHKIKAHRTHSLQGMDANLNGYDYSVRRAWEWGNNALDKATGRWNIHSRLGGGGGGGGGPLLQLYFCL